MARSGSFGTSLSPFGTGALGSLSSYNIGDNLKDLEAYRLEIAWGNGEITDAEYQASLARLVAAADPGTTTQLSAQNKLEDVTYRIGRSQADSAGLDSLIAFDQQSLSGMNANNVRYREVKSSLDSELSQRRSRDYGVLVDAYNAGKTSTESLLAWVTNTLASLSSDAPDRDNWDSVNATLTDRIVSEKDAQIYQDYQDRKMKPADFLAYLTGRRDALDPSSPKWAEANRRLEDGQKNVKDAAQSAIDQDVANRYTDGKISDHTYLVWLGKRVDGLAADDPSRPEWVQRLTLAAHSLAEDQLRHNVKMATTAAGQATAEKALRSFYQAYAVTLNPGSAEYRSTQENILALKPSHVATGGGTAKATAKGTVVVAKPGTPKIIVPTGSFDAALGLMTPNANAPKKDQAISVANLRMNLESATAAQNDKVWLYYDPRYPGQTVTRENPDGTVWRDPTTNKTMQVPGSSYRATSSDEQAGMQVATASYSYGLASAAAAKGDTKGYWTALWHANIALDSARTTQAHAVQRDISTQLDAIDKGITLATQLNDPASVVNLLRMKGTAIQQGIADTSLDQAQRDRLLVKAQEIENNPLLPTYQTDINGNKSKGQDGRYIQIGGFVNVDQSAANADGTLISGGTVLAPGVHFMLDANPTTGDAAWHYKYEDPGLGTWADTHVTIQTGALGRVVTGEVKLDTAATIGVWVTAQDGTKHYVPYQGQANYISYTDGYGNHINGYSVDGGATWVQATGGVLPSLEINSKVNWDVAADGSVTVSGADRVPIFTSDDGVRFQGDMSAPSAAGAVSWMGQAAVESGGDVSGGVGSLGHQFRIVTATAGDNGALLLNFIPTPILQSQFLSQTGVDISGARKQVRESVALPSGSPTVLAKSASGGTAIVVSPTGSKKVVATPTSAGAAGAAYQNYRAGERGYAFDAGAFSSSLASSVAPALQGIIHVGATLLGVAAPPASLLPAYVPLTDSRLPTVSTAPPKTSATVSKAPVRAPVSSAALKTSVAAKTAKLASIPKAPVPPKVVPHQAVV